MIKNEVMAQSRAPVEEKIFPPYLPYKTFDTFIDSLRQGMPSRIDRSLMRSMSGGQQSSLIKALWFLGLVKDTGAPTSPLTRLVLSEGPERREALRDILTRAYDFLFQENGFDLKTATSMQFEEQIRQAGLSGDTVRKAGVFFLAAAQDAGLEISPRLTQRAPRAAASVNQKRRTSTSRRSTRTAAPEMVEEISPQSTQPLSWEQMLLAKFPSFDPAWPDEVKSKWFDAFDKLMHSGQGLTPSN
jgi:hypothetical protein